MILSELIAIVRRRSRVGSDFITDAEVSDSIDEAYKKVAKDTTGLIKQTYLTLAPKFWLHSSMAFNLTIAGGSNVLAATDIVVTATERQGVGGDQAAADLQSQIRAAGAASATVVFSSATWKFTIDALDSTTITVAAASSDRYADAADLLFGLADAQTATSWESNIPQDCTLEIDLPGDFLKIKALEWDRIPLYQSSFDLFVSPQVTGTPHLYYIYNNDKLRIYPIPTDQYLFHLSYYYTPATIRDVQGYQELGLTGKAGTTATGLSASTQYYFKVTKDGTQTEYSITTASDVTWAAVIILMNAQPTGSTFSIVDGDIRCTSDSTGTSSTIALAAGTTGTDLFAALTDFSAFETAITWLSREVDVYDEAEDAVIYYASAILVEEEGDEKRSAYLLARYRQQVNEYKRILANANPKYKQSGTVYRKPYTVTM